jgi:hypothetical protein
MCTKWALGSAIGADASARWLPGGYSGALKMGAVLGAGRPDGSPTGSHKYF